MLEDMVSDQGYICYDSDSDSGAKNETEDDTYALTDAIDVQHRDIICSWVGEPEDRAK